MDGSQGQDWSLVVAVNRSLFETCYPPDVPGRRRLSCRCKWFTVSTPTSISTAPNVRSNSDSRDDVLARSTATEMTALHLAKRVLDGPGLSRQPAAVEHQ